MSMAHHVLAPAVVVNQVVGQQGHPVPIAEGIAQALLLRAIELLAEPVENKFRTGSAELVDGLVRVTHHRDPSPVAGDIPQQQVLDLIGILVLIHQNQIHLVGHQFLQCLALVDGQYRFVKHVSVADSALALAPGFETVEQIDQVAVLVGVAQFLEHDIHR